MSRPRLGAYVLAADPTWLRSSVAAYYDLLDVLVVSAPSSGTGWTGRPVRSAQCVDTVRSLDVRGIARVVTGQWHDAAEPMRAETAQRRDALAAVGSAVDWVLQIDSDELLPDPSALLHVLARADAAGADAVEWPMRVLFRRLRDGRYLQVSAADGAPRYDYPGAIAVRPGTELVDARRTAGAFLRPTVRGDGGSTQLTVAASADETRLELVDDAAAILHNTWARPPADVRAKISTWGHHQGLRSWRYYATTWWPAPLRWRRMRDLHPLFGDLWPRLTVRDGPVDALLAPEDRQTKRLA